MTVVVCVNSDESVHVIHFISGFPEDNKVDHAIQAKPGCEFYTLYDPNDLPARDQRKDWYWSRDQGIVSVRILGPKVKEVLGDDAPNIENPLPDVVKRSRSLGL